MLDAEDLSRKLDRSDGGPAAEEHAVDCSEELERHDPEASAAQAPGNGSHVREKEDRGRGACP